MIQLYYSPGTACLAPHFLLEELGLAYELVLVDTTKQQHQEAAYLQLNPKGKIPFLIDGELHLSESAAICLYLAEKYADGKQVSHFNPALGTTERARLYQWMFYLSNTLQAELLSYFYPERLSDNEATAAQVKAHAEQRVADMLSYIDAQLNRTPGAYLLGQELSCADLFLFMLCRWTRGMTKPAREYPHLTPYLQKLFDRPSIQNSLEQEGISAPYY
ncbi:glutathione S-transferase family protein [Undibacterium seohonense]|uniref:Glutathione S-transferase family protein n=1 Tax=Undibacterium seohonense TaxID=1344950 RepID=A0ABR6X0P7_9BURK|nr:glutathione S-transferase family protein [Undibacterium seohonense]MBC3806451.1 glutathione S-transferase family protein [Undibacterium seohonense]